MTTLSLLFDTGCFVLIWLVQLVIYPSFGYFQSSNLKIWHGLYTQRITLVVLPLMLGQLILTTIEAFSFQYLGILKLVLVVSTWATTFMIFVPLHNKVEKTTNHDVIAKSLVTKNWIRTTLWTAVFLIAVYQQFTP